MATDNVSAAGNDAIFSLEQMRGAYEHRALWLHYLAEKAVEDGENGRFTRQSASAVSITPT